MNAAINIRIRAYTREAKAELRSTATEVRALQASMATGARAANGLISQAAMTSLSRWGSQLQWAGRQLMANFTLPLVAAGSAVTKWVLELETEMTRLRKVYSGADEDVARLAEGFEMLSTRYAISQKDVADVGATWAQAGAKGGALLRGTEQTLKAMVLGEMGAKDSAQAMIALQAQYGATTEELELMVAQLNAVENNTGINFSQLIQGMSRSAGAARTAGVDTGHLAAMLAALVPASGGAEQAGNSLKTMISRIMSPTGKAREVLEAMGISIQDVAWKSSSAVERIGMLADAFHNLEGAGDGMVSSQAAEVSALVASRWNINRFDVLMRDIYNSNKAYREGAAAAGYYGKALEVLTTDAEVLAIAHREINTVLESNPYVVKRAGVVIQNSLMKVITMLMPQILAFVNGIATLAEKFANLDPGLQKAIIGFLAILAVIGPPLALLGAFAVAVGRVGQLMIAVASAPKKLATALGLIKPAASKSAAVQAEAARTAGDAETARASRTTRAATTVRAAFSSIDTAAKNSVRVAATFHASWQSTVAAARAAAAAAAAAWGATAPAASAAGAGASAGAAVALATSPAWAAAGAANAAAYGTALSASLAVEFGKAYAAYLVWLARMAPPAITAGAMSSAGFTSAFVGNINRTLPALGMAGATVGTAVGGGFLARLGAMLRGIPRLISEAFLYGATWIIVFFRTLPGRIMGFLSALPGLLLTFGKRLGVGLVGGLGMALRAIPGILAALGPMIGRVVPLLFGPWGIAIAAALAIFFAFKDQILQIFDNIASQFTRTGSSFSNAWLYIRRLFDKGVGALRKAFNLLPEGVQSSLKAVVTMVRDAALKVYKWFKYINPFAHHSPSLVENVTRGMNIVGNQFQIASERIKVYAKDAYRSLLQFGSATAGFMDKYQAMLAADDRALISEFIPEAVGTYDDLLKKLKPLKVKLESVNRAVERQEQVVEDLKVALDSARAAYDALNYEQERLRASADALSAALDAAQSKLNYFANAPIAGMREMSDAMFDNEMAQKRLQLALMDWEDVHGSVDDVRSQMASLQGDIESLRGTANDLVGAGAGSDVLGPIQAQIAEMESAYDAMQDSVNNSPVNEMQKELERLQREATRLDLENSIKFDPLLREIEQLSTAYEELSFEEIIAGVRTQAAAVADLQAQYDAASAAVELHQVQVDAAQAAADEAQRAYDIQSQALEGLRYAYQAVETEVRAIEDAINAVIEAAQAMQGALESAAAARAGAASGSGSDYLSNFDALAGGAYEDVGGSAIIANEDFSIDEWMDNFLTESGTLFEGFDIFGGIKDAWNSFQNWWNENVYPIFRELGTGIGWIFDGIDMTPIENIKSTLGGWWDTLVGWGKTIGELFGPQITNIWENIKSAWGPAVDTIMEKVGPLWEGLQNLFAQLGPLIQTAWTVVAPILAGIAAGIGSALSVIFRILGNIIGPIIEWIGNIIGSVIQVISGIINVVAGVIQFIVGMVNTVIQFFRALFTGDWSGFQEAAQSMWDGITRVARGISEILGAVWSAIWNTISGFIAVIVGAVVGFVQGIIDWFTWLWDVLVGHSIIPDMVNSIIDWFRNLWNTVVDFVSNLVQNVVDFFTDLWDYAVAIFTGMKNSIILAWELIKSGLKAAWDWINNNVFDKIKQGVGWVVDKFTLAKDSVVLAWNIMRDMLVTWFNNVRDNVFDKVKQAVGWVGDRFEDVKNRIGVAWDLLKSGLETVSNWIQTNVFDRLKSAVEAVGTAFDSTKNFIKEAWDKIANIARKPVNFIIETVYTNGIKAVWDKIANAVGLNLTLPTVSPVKAFAQGTEDHRAQIARGGAMRLWAEPETGGEAYIPLAPSKRARSTDILGKVASNFGYSLMPYADGGFFGGIASVVSKGVSGIRSAADWVKSAVVNVANFIADPIGGVANMIAEPVKALLGDVDPARGLSQLLVEVPPKVIKTLGQKAKSLTEGLSEGGTYGGALAGWRRPMIGGRITSAYGPRWGAFHNGVDFAGGGRTYASNNGVVRKVGWNVGYGNTGIGILLSHGGGLESYYGHNPSLSSVKVRPGQQVVAGQHIGHEGATGRVTGVHLHYSMFRGGKAINPMPYAGGSVSGGRGGPRLYDAGGWLPAGHSSVVNRTGRPEPVLTGGQWDSIANMVRAITVIAPVIQRSALAGSATSQVQSELARAVRSLESSIDQSASQPAVTENHFHGNLVFPNVRTGDDAERFIENLIDLSER